MATKTKQAQPKVNKNNIRNKAEEERIIKPKNYFL